jgi:hypothetical protein
VNNAEIKEETTKKNSIFFLKRSPGRKFEVFKFRQLVKTLLSWIWMTRWIRKLNKNRTSWMCVCVFKSHISFFLEYQIWSLYANSRGGHNSLTGWWVSHNELKCQFWNIFWFGVLLTLLKMINPSNGQHLGHQNLIPPSSLIDLSWASKNFRSKWNQMELAHVYT